MKKALEIIGVIFMSILISVGILIWYFNKAEVVKDVENVGSVSQGSEYHFTQLTGAIATTSAIGTNTSVLGSVIITEDQVGAVVLWDATSTAAVDNGLSRRIADFQTAEPEEAYPFDVWLKYGLVYVSDDGYLFAGDWTLTYR